jgi:two-component system, OmpR family, phosphate regulon sensor histidine kinase PhoR
VRRGVFLNLLLAFLVVIATTTVTIDLTVRRAWENSLRHQIEQNLQEKALLFAARVQAEKIATPQQLANEEAAAANARATIIDQSGKVLADSQANSEKMENHGTRPEFQAALSGKNGIAQRRSHSVGIPFLYVAAPVPGGAVRLAYPLASISQTTSNVRRMLLVASLLALAVAMVLAAVLAQMVSLRLRKIVGFAERVAAGDLSARIAEGATDEIATVAGTLDRTARKLQESFTAVETSRRQLETLLNSMQEAVIATASDGRVQWVNGRMQRLLGHGVRIGSPTVETVRDPNFLAAIEAASTRGEIAVTRATSLLPGRIFQVTAAPMPPAGAVAVLHDLTELERVEKTRRDFIANVSHELRTPLTSVQGYAETLLDSPAADNPATREFLEIIVKNAGRMTRLTEDLLVLARVESGEQRFDVRPVSPTDLLEDALESLGIAAQEAGLSLTIEDSVSEKVMADPEAIHQVLSNLIRNAMNYARDGEKIQIGALKKDEYVEFYIRDFGPGIPSEHLPRLFERFYRVDKARSRETGGTGLGLAIVKHIVRAHQGNVHAESRLGHGSTFFFTLPLAERTVAAAESERSFTRI